jgi:hypothetical protein
MDIETFRKAIINYIQDPRKSFGNLIDYAKLFKVSKALDEIVGLWL